MLRPLSEVGKDVARLRREQEMSQAELARLSGVSRSTISSLESGERDNIGWEKMVAISKVLRYLPLMNGHLSLVRQIGEAANDLKLGINDAGLLLFPIHIPGVATRYEVLTPELLAKVAECL